ncbi:ATP-binding cassette domain-containing protein [Heyndrickxia coagulans]|uniref:ATP-binding cassette domain-containing protein n=1 Tax=Heyndrickxia TaxID=2837504 RepID=UPI00105B7628
MYPGASGCVKTTLLNVIAGFQAPDSGKVIIVGNRHAKTSPDVGAVSATKFIPGCQMKTNRRFFPSGNCEWKSRC